MPPFHTAPKAGRIRACNQESLDTAILRASYLYHPQMNKMGDPASLSCAENIALFNLLHASRKEGTLGKDCVPARPSVGPVESLTIHREDYVLSFERERSLAGALAYLSNIKDDPNRIPAICIEEVHRPRGKSSLRILLAVNKSEYKDGDDFLQTIKTGFEGIFAELSQAVDDSKLLYTPRCLRFAADCYGIQ